MPAPTPLPLRQQLYELHRAGLSVPQIAQQLGLPQRTARHLLATWRARGPADLGPLPPAGGRALPPARLALRGCCLDLRREQPGWGAGRIRLELQKLHPAAQVPPRAPCSAGCAGPA
jgi:hypothetical protein